MKDIQDWILIDEIVLQAKIAQRARARLQTATDNSDHIEFWSSTQSVARLCRVTSIKWHPATKCFKEKASAAHF